MKWKHKIGQKIIDVADYFGSHTAPYGEVVENDDRLADYLVSFGTHYTRSTMRNEEHVLPQTPLTCLIFPERE